MIKTFVKFSAACAAVIVSTTLAAHATILSGTYMETNMVAFTPLWDLSGEYAQDVPDLGTFDLVITNEPTGKFSGAGTIMVDEVVRKVVDLSVDTNATVSGQVIGSSKKPFVILKLDYSASGQLGEFDFKSLKQKFTGVFGLEGTNLTGKGVSDFSASIKDPKNGKFVPEGASVPVKNIEIPLADDSTGQWALVLDLADASDTKYGTNSSASIVTSTGNGLDFSKVTGTYSSKTDKSTLELKGPKDSNCNLTLVITDEAMTIDSINGKLFGQTLNYKASTKD
jgi:hypothetical protein